MKPYEIEIFDRQFNFKYNALIDEADFTYKFDAISPEKNRVAISKDFQPSQLSSDVSAPKGWLIRILSERKEFQGIISGFEKGEKNNTIEYLQPVAIFDVEIPVTPKDGANVVMETFIKDILTANFSNSIDSYQNITNLQIPTPSTSTTGTFNFATRSEEDRVNVNIVDDILADALQNGVATNVSFNFSSKSVTVNIGKSTSTVTIESHLPNVIEKSFIIRKATNEINRADIYDIYLDTLYQYFLHSDYTYSKINTDRLLPIHNSVYHFDGYEIAQAIIDQTILDNIQSASTVIFYNGNVPYSLYDELSAINLGNDLLNKQNWFEERLKDYAKGYDTTAPYTYTNMGTEYDYAKSGDSYSYRGTNGGDIPWSPWGYYWSKVRQDGYDGHVFEFTCSFSNFALATKDYHLADYIDSVGVVSNAHYSYGRVVRNVERPSQGIAYKTTIQDLLNNFSHIIIQENYTYTVSTHIKYYNAEETMVVYETGDTFNTTMMCMVPITYEDVVWGLSAYAGSQEYIDDIIALAPSASESQADLLAQTAFAANKYTNLIEITTKTGDTMINPLSLPIGQVANLIQDNVSYNSILTGYEIKSELIKLIFGTIRLDLTKLLRERS